MATATHNIPELDRKGLRGFGIVTGGIFALLFGIFLPWLFEKDVPLWPWVLAGSLTLCALLAPQGLRRVYRLWMRFGLLVNRVTTPIILAIVFFAVIVPAALVMKLIGRDPMARRFDDQIKSYRVPSHSPKRENMEKPF